MIKGIKSGESASIICKDKYGSVHDTILIYCVEPINSVKEYSAKRPLTFIYAQPGSGKIIDLNLDLSFYAHIFQIVFKELARFLSIISSTPQAAFGLSFGKFEVHGRINDYCYVRYKDSNFHDGFVHYNDIDGKIDSFLYISCQNMNVWADGIARDSYQLTATYPGKVTWTVSDTEIIEYDVNSHLVKGLKPGTATITAEADGMKQVCTVHSIYKWKQGWKVTAKNDLSIYRADRNDFVKNTTLSSGKTFTVVGDAGAKGIDSWAYGYSENNVWGYVQISDISTKSTVSYYNNLEWTWPVVTPTNKNDANYISSPYGKRDSNPSMHKGIDISTGNSGEINGYGVVSAFSGEVIYVSTSSSNSTGYCVGVKSDITDPVSNEYFVAFYMHLKDIPSVRRGQKVSKGSTLGYVGSTGNSGGDHLHFEINNKNASIGDGSTARQYYAYLINPLFFFINKTVRINPNCDAEVKYYGAYWYGND